MMNPGRRVPARVHPSSTDPGSSALAHHLGHLFRARHAVELPDQTITFAHHYAWRAAKAGGFHQLLILIEDSLSPAGNAAGRFDIVPGGSLLVLQLRLCRIIR